MELDEDLKAFLVESHENLNTLEGDLVVLEQHPTDQDLMNAIYRSLHTLKGNCGFLGLEKLQTVAHSGESLLSRLRDGQLVLTAEITSALLHVIDAIKQILTVLNTTGEEGDVDYTHLIDQLERLQHPGSVDPEPLPLESVHDPVTENVVPDVSDHDSVKENVVPDVSELDSSPVLQSFQSVDQNLQASTLENEPEPAMSSQGQGLADSAIRVDVELLDKLMNLVGELVLCRNQILEFGNSRTDRKLLETSQRLNVVTTELQGGVMQTRMQPIRNIWNKFPRVVRDLSISVGKQVRLEMEGKNTELDKTLIEAIADPLTHLVRNCVDHGIEAPDARIACGKPAEGKLFLRAFHESGYVNIDIKDDGAGIDTGALKLKGIQKGLITNEQAARFSEQETLNLIFLPGFSTAKTVSNLSGRGVGMDVVRTNIERIGGTVDIHSQRGHGTTFRLKIPLTLAIIPTLIVVSGGHRFAIPQVSLLELVRLEGKKASKAIEMVHGTPVYRLREQLLPLVYLNKELELSSATEHTSGNDEVDERLNIVVLQSTNRPFGLIVDGINDTQEIVVKSLGKQLRGLSCFAGATIMGDGSVALILDVHGLAQKAHVLSDTKDMNLDTEHAATVFQNQNNNLQMLLLFKGPEDRHMALPLDRVARLEKLPARAIEHTGHRQVIQYRQQILPLVYLSSFLSNHPETVRPVGIDEMLEVVVVPMNGEQNVGLVVDHILDIVEEQLIVKGVTAQLGIEYSTVIQGQVTEVINVNAVVRALALELFQETPAA